jgi:hypothetical protein
MTLLACGPAIAAVTSQLLPSSSSSHHQLVCAPAGKAVILDSSGKGQGHSQGQVHTLHSWALATGTVVVASSATYPLDVIRKRMVMEVASGKGGYSGFGAMVRHVARTEGLAGFYRFYGVDMLFRSGAGILLVLYDKMQHWQARREESRGAQS